MTVRTAIRPLAELDILDQAEFIAKTSPDQARRFADSVITTIKSLADFPDSGRITEITLPRLESLRWIAVENLPNHLIFYITDREVLTVVRVLHGSRDLPNTLGDAL